MEREREEIRRMREKERKRGNGVRVDNEIISIGCMTHNQKQDKQEEQDMCSCG